MTPADILEAAADLIAVNGWWDGSPKEFFSDAGTSCVMTALMQVRTAESLLEAEAVFLAYVGQQDTNPDLHPIAAWNDTPGRTAGEVMDTMRSAAKAWREVNEP